MLTLTAAGPLEYVVMVAVLMVIVTMITCICWRGKRPSAENLGLPGRIKVTNQEDAGATLNGTSSYAVGREDTRLSALHRELPQIPTALGDADPRRSSSAPSEHTSELYAVVADPAAATATATGSPGVTAAGAGAAQGGRPAERTEQEEQPESDGYYEQPALTRSRAERQSSQPPTSSHSRNPSTASREIPARLAVSGVVPASHELPYMTPPVHRLPVEAAPPAQLHFSGDSVQSADSRGYTRITVREPAAELTLTERPAGGPAAAAAGAAPSADNFYATVDGSDDEMYEAIPERRRRVEQPPPPPPPPPPLSAGEDQPDGSDGHPEPPVTPVGSIGGSGGGGRAGSVEPAVTSSGGQRTNVPPPPSVDSLRQALVHSRQASCSSVASSGGSPPPDRRLARSPLPPLPDLDQLYAKVQKTPRPPAAGSPPPPPPPPEPVYQAADPPPPVNYSDFELVRDPIRRPRPVVRRESSLDPNYESIETRSRRAAAADDADDDAEDAGYDRVRRVDSAVGAGGGSDDGAGYARVLRPAAGADGAADPAPPRRREHHYERVRRRRDEDPLYEKISSSPAASEVYDEIRWPRGPRPQPPSDAESFYESVRFGSELDADPNYEMLPAKPGSDPEELYSCIWDRRGAEDPYASIKRSDSPPYESIARPPPIDSDSDSDTIGYESVRAAPSSAAGSSNHEDRATPLVVDPAVPATDRGGDPATTAADLSQLYAKVQKVQRQAAGQQAEVAPPIPDALWTMAPSEPDDSGAVVRMDSSSASTSQYTSASEAGTPLLPKRFDDLDSPRRRRSTTSVDSGSVTQSERDELMPPP